MMIDIRFSSRTIRLDVAAIDALVWDECTSSCGIHLRGGQTLMVPVEDCLEQILAAIHARTVRAGADPDDSPIGASADYGAAALRGALADLERQLAEDEDADAPPDQGGAA